MDAAELSLLRASFEAVLRQESGRAVLPLLDDLGWAELLEAEPASAVAELFETQGRLVALAPGLDLVVADAAGRRLGPAETVVHPSLSAWDTPPGTAGDVQPGTRTTGVVVDGLLVGGPPAGGRLLVACRAASGDDFLAEVPVETLEVNAVAGFDPGLGLSRVSGRAPGDVSPLPAGWGHLTAGARRALAHELVGVAAEALDVAARHVTDRLQFGRPIAAFQTVRHRLTEVYVAIASARGALDAAWAEPGPVTTDAAKALAGRAALLAAKHCLQVTGAIGFTGEYELHRRIRRAHLLDGLYGTGQALQARIGATLLADRRVPRVHALP